MKESTHSGCRRFAGTKGTSKATAIDGKQRTEGQSEGREGKGDIDAQTHMDTRTHTRVRVCARTCTDSLTNTYTDA